VCNSVKAGITYAATAGNSGENAGSHVPGGYGEVITVSAWSDTNGASDATGPTYNCLGWGVQTDETWATGTDWGTSVEIAAPGVGIKSTWIGSSYALDCGTSMASPHVAGAAALVLNKFPSLTPAEVRQKLVDTAAALPDNAQHVENLLNVSGF
jgi:subtilisin